MHARVEAVAAERPLASPVGLAVGLFLLSEAFLFGSLFIIYYYLRMHTHHWPPEGAEVHLVSGGINTGVLLLSSLTVSLAVGAIQRDRVQAAVAWLGATLGLGALFFGIKMFEWATNTFGPADHAYGSIYYTLTGFHALHVLVGLGIIGALLTRTLKGRFSSRRFLGMELGTLYWHFVDGVWLLVFATIYLVR
jgi:cytochrome c oxidase subunit 3